jgi:isoleucyl-tRNA synthetase
LQFYLESELNVREIVFTTDESRTGVKYRAVADWATLGRKLRKDIGRVKKALPDVSSDAIRSYVQTGRLSVDGIELVAGDLTVSRYVDLPENGTFATATDSDAVVVLDIQLHPELEGEGVARELINRIQKLRKKAGLQATDDVDVFYRFAPGSNDVLLKDVMRSHAEIIQRTVRSVPAAVSSRKPDAKVLIEETQEIGETTFDLSLAWPSI